MRQKKKLWIKPKLIVFMRSKQDEYILAGCKTGSYSGSASSQSTKFDSVCTYIPFSVACAPCADYKPS